MTTQAIQNALLTPEEKKVMEAIFASTSGTASAGGVESAVASYVSVEEFGGGGVHSTVLTLNNFPMTLRDTELGVGVKVYTFPKGKIYTLGCSADDVQVQLMSALTTLNSGVTCGFGVGSTTQANGTLATTEQNFVNVTTFTSPTAQYGLSAAVRGFGIPLTTALDGSGTAIAAFVNIGIPTLTDIDANADVRVFGKITLNWVRS